MIVDNESQSPVLELISNAVMQTQYKRPPMTRLKQKLFKEEWSFIVGFKRLGEK